MKILIQFNTRSRPNKFLEVLEKYYNFAEDKDKLFINVSCDNDDDTMNNDIMRGKVGEYENVRIIYNENKTKIDSVNVGFDDLEYDIILLASDDMIPEIKGYDNIIREGMVKNFPDTDGILWFNDGNQGRNLNTLCILGKKYYDRFGYIYNPKYKSLWADNEFTIVGNMLGKQVYDNKVIIRHKHHSVDGETHFDPLYQKNDTFHDEDRDVYNFRSRKKFDLQ